MDKVFAMSVASVYPLYVTKVKRKGRTVAELDEAICWLTGYSEDELRDHLDRESSFREFFAAARLNPSASLITGVVCGVRVEDIADPLEQQVRYLDKIVDEIARGRSLAKVLRQPAT